MKKITFLSLILLCLTAVLAAPAPKQPDSREVFTQWMARYYLKPNPDQVISRFRTAHKEGILGEKFRWNTMIGFVSGVVKQSPQLSQPLAEFIISLPDHEREPLIMGLSYAGHEQGRAALESIGRGLPVYQKGIQRMLEQPPGDITRRYPLENNPGALDVNWGYFGATGTFTPLERIMSTLPWRHLKEDGTAQTTTKILIGKLAYNSLKTHYKTSPRVSMFCRQALKTQPQPVVEALRLVMAK